VDLESRKIDLVLSGAKEAEFAPGQASAPAKREQARREQEQPSKRNRKQRAPEPVAVFDDEEPGFFKPPRRVRATKTTSAAAKNAAKKSAKKPVATKATAKKTASKTSRKKK
jgi:hypothetical protein